MFYGPEGGEARTGVGALNGFSSRVAAGEEGTMGLIWTIVVGFLAGVVAKFIFPGKESMGFLMTTVLGIAGALVASFLGKMLGWYEPGEGAGFIGAIVGALLLLCIYSRMQKKTA